MSKNSVEKLCYMVFNNNEEKEYLIVQENVYTSSKYFKL